MRFYHATRWVFPRSYHLRIFAICFGAVHLPIAVFCLAELVLGQWDWAVFLPLLGATLVGTGAAIVALHAMLAPIAHATDLLRTIQRGGRVPAVPVGGEDLVGELLTGVARASAATAARITTLTDAAGKDMLTGLLNRRGFTDVAAHTLRADATSAIALLDLDHFKAINDRFGHDEGDRVLTAFARRLEAGLRKGDSAARWGGEEFAILMPETDLEDATAIIERLRLLLSLDNISAADSPALTFSCGVTALQGYQSFDAALVKADQALYAAKRGGRDRVERRR
ncbi:GGDEF domain-containing protein [Sphingomonas crusticola]|uniref:GGDEF domain-containing protein n=1 Tax=Sphingomonas crusticola TaxID=1697973 RepID=UPI000E2311D1|nr:GGDEF domain-containing protein [Sphingomonas crusticola]